MKKLWMVDVTTGRHSYVQRSNPLVGGWFADANGVVRMAFSGDRDNGFGLRMQDDLDDVITHLAAQGTVDANRVCVWQRCRPFSYILRGRLGNIHIIAL